MICWDASSAPMHQAASTIPLLPNFPTNPLFKPNAFSISSAGMPCSSLNTNIFLTIATSTKLFPSKPFLPAATFSFSASSAMRCLAASMATAGLAAGLGKTPDLTAGAPAEPPPGPSAAVRSREGVVGAVVVVRAEPVREEGEYVG